MSATEPIRILSLTYAEDRFTNAQQENAREIARRLDPARFEVTLLQAGGGPAPVLEAPAVRGLPLPSRLSSLAILRRLLSRRQDLVLYPGHGLPEAVCLALPRALRGRARWLVPVEGDVRQLDEVSPTVRRRVDRLHRRADALFPITEHVARSLEARAGRHGTVIPVGVDTARFAPREGPRRPGPLRVLSVGAVKAWKRPEFAVAAARAHPDVEFRWIGDGDLLPAIASVSPRNLAWSGPLPHGALPEACRDADVFLHPSRMEGLPKAVLEAMACGVPVVLFDAYDPDFVREAGGGIVVGTEAEMLAALGRLLASESERVERGRAARTTALAFDWDRVATSWAAAFEREAKIARG